MFAHVLYCLDEIEAELENLTSSASENELAVGLSDHLQAMRRLVTLATEASGPADTAFGAGVFLLSAEDDLSFAIQDDAPAAEVETLEVEDDIAAEIVADEPVAAEAATLEVEDDIAAEIETDEPATAVLIVIDQLIAEASTDDLTLIRGVDAALAQELAAHGITRFATIAAWTTADIASIATTASPQRIAKENWIEQAALLAAGTMTTFATAALEAKTADEVAPLEVSETASTDEADALVEPAANVISLEMHKRLAEGLVSRLPAKTSSGSAPAVAQVISFTTAQVAKQAASNRWMLKVAACLAIVACAGIASLQTTDPATSITWVIGAL